MEPVVCPIVRARSIADSEKHVTRSLFCSNRCFDSLRTHPQLGQPVAPLRYAALEQCVSPARSSRSEEHTSELQSRLHLVCRLLLEKKKQNTLLPEIVQFDKQHN